MIYVGEKRHEQKFFVRKTEIKKLLRRFMRGWKGSIKTFLIETGWECVNCINHSHVSRGS